MAEVKNSDRDRASSVEQERAAGERFPAPAYARTVLSENFKDARDQFLDCLFDLHYAHLAMLVEQRIVSTADGAQIAAALDRVDRSELRKAQYDGTYEDFFFYLEAEIARHCDPEVAGRLHTARSRNDIAITLYRMRVREELLKVHSAVRQLSATLLHLTAEHYATVMPAHTHTQPAQPTTLAHYLLAAVEFLDRDLTRIESAYATVNRSPLGACAITTTGFPIDRDRQAELLGFDELQTNSYGAIAAVDYLLESAGALSTLAINAGKLVHDLLLWSMQEFHWLKLGAAYVQISSIMPQKRNPVAIEHVRILLSRAFAEAQGIAVTAHNTPFGDIVDSEDDLMPLVFQAFGDTQRGIELLAAALGHVEVDRDRLRQQAGANFLTLTELADTLVRLTGMSFREAHHIASASVKADPADDSHQRIVSAAIRIGHDEFRRDLNQHRERLLHALEPVSFVAMRAIPGGPAPQEARRQHDQLASQLEQHSDHAARAQLRLDQASDALRQAHAALLQASHV